ncbi:MAG: 1-deoxy-D-xylulose-5-phosphate reductoisomerase [Bacteroidales bacterium]|nr:1-deoxy-D-xylulose-5-phosphate reductoisomerase [Bacteroidales bacterium]
MTNQKKIAILGSTGSIGTQTLDVIAQYPDRFKATVLIAGTRVDTLIQQALQFRPEWAIIADVAQYWKLREALEPAGIRTAAGQDAINDAMMLDCFDTVVTATVGYSGLTPTLRAIRAGKQIALANKETLVVAGDIVCKALAESRSTMLPVDSEHSAIYQCLVGENHDRVRKVIITASGGPFRSFTKEQIEAATVKDALHHPNWNMGAKITIDSATMLNKAFEIIEARWLFNLTPDQIEPLVHPQSIVHSMVEFVDGAVKAQLGIPDMRLPIRYALGETTRLDAPEEHLDFTKYPTLTFEKPDEEKFPCITLADLALTRGGNTACVINAANEVAVKAFLTEKIKFTNIYPLITETLAHIPFIESPSYEDYVACNDESRAIATEIAEKISNRI